MNTTTIITSLLSGLTIGLSLPAAPQLAPDCDDTDANDAVFVDAPHMPIAMQARAEQNVGDVVITAEDVERAFAFVCGAPRDLVQGSGTVRTCEYRPLAKGKVSR